MKALCTHFLCFVFSTALLSAAQPQNRPTMNEFIGINGHTVQFKPELYQPVARLVRDYHPISWDLGRPPRNPASFPQAKNKVDWSKVYGSWKEKGWMTDACLMFAPIEVGEWEDLEKDTKEYGRAFAAEFGPSGERKLVESVEIGNEPGKWSDEDYSRVFKAMATGVREGDPAMKIATCNVIVGEAGDYEKSVSCIEKFPELVDVLSTHTYAQLEGWPTWKRSFPEDLALPKYLRDIESLSAWRDKNMPGKPIWITEFGYDSTTKPQEKTGDFTKWEGVSDERQAQWNVRSLLVFSSMDVQRAYIYFFNDSDSPRVHGSSGLTRNFEPKPSFHAVAHFRKTLGDFRFNRIVTDEVGKLRVQEYVNATDEGKLVWAVWSPTAKSGTETMTLRKVPGKLISSSLMPLVPGPAVAASASQQESGDVEVEVGGSPVYLILEK